MGKFTASWTKNINGPDKLFWSQTGHTIWLPLYHYSFVLAHHSYQVENMSIFNVIKVSKYKQVTKIKLLEIKFLVSYSKLFFRLLNHRISRGEKMIGVIEIHFPSLILASWNCLYVTYFCNIPREKSENVKTSYANFCLVFFAVLMMSHGIFCSPFLGRLVVLFPVCFVNSCYFWYKRIVRIWVS